jgi:hypothetical protein
MISQQQKHSIENAAELTSTQGITPRLTKTKKAPPAHPPAVLQPVLAQSTTQNGQPHGTIRGVIKTNDIASHADKPQQMSR